MNATLAPYSPPTYQMPDGAQYGQPPVGGTFIPQPPAARNVPTFLGLLNALKRRWVLACFLGLLVGLAAAVALWIAAPQGKHNVKAMLEVRQQKKNLVDDTNGDPQSHENFKQNLVVLVKGRTLLGQVAQRKNVNGLPLIAQAEDPIAAIDNILKPRWPAPDLLELTMNGDRAEDLKIILNELCDAFTMDINSKAQGTQAARKASLNELLVDYKKRIDSFERDAELLSKENGLGVVTLDMLNMRTGMLAQQAQQDRSRLGTIETDLVQLNAQLVAKSTELEFLEKKQYRTDEIEAALLREKDTSLQRLQAELDDELNRLADNEKRFVDKNAAALRASREKVERLRSKRAAMAEQRRSEVEKRLRIDQQTELDKELRIIKDRLVSAEAQKTLLTQTIADVEQKLNTLSKDTTSMAKKYNDVIKPLYDHVQTLTRQIQDIDVQLKGQGQVSIAERPVIIPHQNLRQKLIWCVAIGTISFLGVIAAVAFLEWRSRRVDSVDQVVNELGMRIIGTIPAFPSRASIKAGEADANQNWRFILNESVNSTRTMLLHTAKTQQMQVLMVTSAMQGEGKTSLASQLATSMATAGLRTLVLDCDLRNPSIHRLFDLPMAPGVSEILLSEIDVSDAVQPTTVPNLWVVPAGQCSNRVIAALAQGHPLEGLFNRLRGQFDFIVVDSCPVLPVADALLIGQHVDGVLISILQDISQLPKVMNTSERLAQLGIPVLGAVVNGIKTDIHAYGYNYVKQLPA